MKFNAIQCNAMITLFFMLQMHSVLHQYTLQAVQAVSAKQEVLLMHCWRQLYSTPLVSQLSGPFIPKKLIAQNLNLFDEWKIRGVDFIAVESKESRNILRLCKLQCSIYGENSRASPPIFYCQTSIEVVVGKISGPYCQHNTYIGTKMSKAGNKRSKFAAFESKQS